MKIYAVNSSQPVAGTFIYNMVADSSLTPWRKPLFLPDFDEHFTLRLSPAVYLSRLGKSIARRFAPRYYEEGAVGFMLRAEGLYARLAAAGLPTCQAVSFDESAMISPKMPFAELASMCSAGIRIYVNGELRQTVATPDLAGRMDDAIANLSRNTTLKTGDVIFADLPDTGVDIAEGDRILFASAADDSPIHQFTIK